MKENIYYIAGGGTAGHVNPALSIAETIRKEEPDSKIVFFVTEDGIEKKMTKEAGYPSIVIKANRYPNSPSDVFSFLKASCSGCRTCRNVIKQERPTAIIGTGGFVSGPLLLAAIREKIPYLIHEQNAFPGKANRLLAKKASAICISFEASREYFNTDAPVVFTGNPIRKNFFEISSVKARQILEVPSEKFLVVIMGGSLGSGSINQAIIDLFQKNAWQDFKKEFPELMLSISSGRNNYDNLMKTLSSYDLEDVYIKSYLDSVNWLAAADLYIGRAGASSCFETAATETPAIFLPFPNSANNHQYYNAKSFSSDQAGFLIEEKDFNVTVMLDHIRFLIENRAVLYKMSQCIKSKAMPDAAARIVEVLNQITK